MKVKYEKAWVEIYNKEWIEEIYKEVDVLKAVYPADIFFSLDNLDKLMEDYTKGILAIKYRDKPTTRILLWGEESEDR